MSTDPELQVKVTEVDLPLKGLKTKVLQEIASPEGYNFQFTGGVRIEFPRGLRYYIWTFIPPRDTYTWFELETVAQEIFDKFARKKGKKSPAVTSVGIEGEAMLVIEALGAKK